MNATRHPVVAIVTHGAAVVLGVFAVLRWPSPSGASWHQANPVTQPGDGLSNDRPAAWIESSLQQVRERVARAEKGTPIVLSVTETIRTRRVKAEENSRKLGKRLERIALAARKQRPDSNPAEAIRAALRQNVNQDDVALTILHAWLNRDPDAALTELGRNHALLREEAVPNLLERKFGNEWITRQIGDDRVSYRLRTALVSGIGRSLAREGGLDELLQLYNLIADPKLKTELVTSFVGRLPMDEPETTARFLARDAPEDLRRQMIEEFSYPMEPSSRDESHEWFEQLCALMPPELVPERFREPSHSPENEATEPLPATATLEEIVTAAIKNGRSREEAVELVMSSKVREVIDEGIDLMELYGEGRISRGELLEELRHRIPGAESHPEVLERSAWQQTAMDSDPRQAMAWADELSKRGDMTPLMESAFTSLFMNDPRIMQRLERLQTIRSNMSDGSFRSELQDYQVSKWRGWRDISPAAARAWRDALPSADSLREALQQEDHKNPDLKETP